MHNIVTFSDLSYSENFEMEIVKKKKIVIRMKNFTKENPMLKTQDTQGKILSFSSVILLDAI